MSKQLVRLNPDNIPDHAWLSCVGSNLRICTAYTEPRVGGHIWIPLDTLIKQQVSMSNIYPSFYETGHRIVDDKPCALIKQSWVDVICD